MGIFNFGPDGPSKMPIAVVTAPKGYAFGAFAFGRNENWISYVLTAPKKVTPTSYICHWRTNEHIRISEFGKYAITDFYDEADVIPAGARLEGITVCSDSPGNSPLEHEFSNVGRTRRLRVVGHFSAAGEKYSPQLRDGITWTVERSKLELTACTYTGLAEARKIPVTAEYKGKRDSFFVTLLPKLTGDGFRAEYFRDAEFKDRAVARVEPRIFARWAGRSSPDKSVDGRKPWSARWTGLLNVQTAGDYIFYFLQGEGNDRFLKDKDGNWTKTPGWSVWLDDKLVLTATKRKNYPWVDPRRTDPIRLSKGRHVIRVETRDVSGHPVVAELYWSGPNIRKTLLAKPYVHSNGKK
jgi:hypothetical protein